MERIVLTPTQAELLRKLDFNESPSILLEGGGTFKEEQRGRRVIGFIASITKQTPEPTLEDIYEVTSQLLLDAIVSPHLRRGILLGITESDQREGIKTQLNRVRTVLLADFSPESSSQ